MCASGKHAGACVNFRVQMSAEANPASDSRSGATGCQRVGCITGITTWIARVRCPYRNDRRTARSAKWMAFPISSRSKAVGLLIGWLGQETVHSYWPVLGAAERLRREYSTSRPPRLFARTSIARPALFIGVLDQRVPQALLQHPCISSHCVPRNLAKNRVCDNAGVALPKVLFRIPGQFRNLKSHVTAIEVVLQDVPHIVLHQGML